MGEMKQVDGSASVSTATKPEPKYRASISTGPYPFLPPEFAKAILELQKILEMPVYLLVQNYVAPEGEHHFEEIDYELYHGFAVQISKLPDRPIALVIDSPGGSANHAYKIANLFRQRCGGFQAIIPDYAKSAATLLALGANEIILGSQGELGPLDAQIEDPESEANFSALDEVQSLERLHAFALEAFDRTMLLLIRKTRKKVVTLLPMTLHFVSDMMRPLFEKIDVVHYTQMSRSLKLAEEYAVRLLEGRYPVGKARDIARELVEKYPEHGFVLDGKEMARIDAGLTRPASATVQTIMDRMYPWMQNIIAIGQIEEVNDENV